MKAFITKWDESQGYNKCGSDATIIVTHHANASMASFWGKVSRDAAPGMSRIEVYWNDDKIYGKPDVVGYMDGGRILSYNERMAYETQLPVEQQIIPNR